VLPDAYSEAILLAVKETGLDRKTFPQSSAYSLAEILGERKISLED
jgi:hypothetical protein